MESEAAAVRAADSMSEFEMDKAVSSMVRFALFCHTRNALIRKEDLTKKGIRQLLIRIAGGHTKAFAVIFNRANEYLERVFSMRLLTVTEKKTWIMISTLVDKSLLKTDPRDVLHMIILVIIFGSNHSITHDTLLSILSDLQIDDTYLNDESIPASSLSAYLGVMVKQNYLEKETSPDFESPLYTWGQRSKLEVPPESLIRFITSVLSSLFNTRFMIWIKFLKINYQRNLPKEYKDNSFIN